MTSEEQPLKLTIFTIGGSESAITLSVDGSMFDLRRAAGELLDVIPARVQLSMDGCLLPREGLLREAGIIANHHVSAVTLPMAIPEYTSLVLTASENCGTLGSIDGFCFDPKGTLLIADCYYDRGVRLLNFCGEDVMLVSNPGDGPDSSDEDQGGDTPPCEWGRGICAGPGGQSVFISCKGEQTFAVMELSVLEDSTRVMRVLTPEVWYPMLLCLSPDESTLAVLDAQSGPNSQQRVWLHRTDALVDLISVGGPAGYDDGHFTQYPAGLAITPDGQLLVSSDTRIQAFGLDGSFRHKIDIGQAAGAIAVDALGNIICVVDGIRLQVFNPEWTLLHDEISGTLDSPCRHIAIDHSIGRIAVGGELLRILDTQ